jgi:hypothetical protein
MFGSCNNAANQMAQEFARLEKERMMKLQQQRLRQQNLSQSQHSRTENNSSNNSKGSTSNGPSSSTTSKNNPPRRGGLFGFMKSSMRITRRDLGDGGAVVATDTPVAEKSSKGNTATTVTTEETQEASVQSARSRVSVGSLGEGEKPPRPNHIDIKEETQEASVRSARSRAYVGSMSKGEQSPRPNNDIKKPTEKAVRAKSGGEQTPADPPSSKGRILSDTTAELASPRRRTRRSKTRSKDVPKFLTEDKDDSRSVRSKDVSKFLPEDKDDSRVVEESQGTTTTTTEGPRSVAEQPDKGNVEPMSPTTATTACSTKNTPNKPANSKKASTKIAEGDDKKGEESNVVPLVVIELEGGESTLDSTPKKRSILKVSKPGENAVRTTPPPLAPIACSMPLTFDNTIVIRRGAMEDDIITCITMDDFNTFKPKRRPKRISKRNLASSNKRSDQSRESDGSSGTLSDTRLARIIRKDIRSKKESILIAGLAAISELAGMGSKQRSKIVHFGALPSILRVVETKKSAVVLSNVFVTLQKVIAGDRKHQEAACELGGIRAITTAMQSKMANATLVGAACKTLDVITACMRLSSEDDQDDYDKIPTQGAVTVLSCCLMANPKDKDILAYAFSTLANLCMHRPDKLQMLSEAGGVTSMSVAVEHKWKSKSKKAQALEDLPIIIESLEDDDESDSSSSSEEEDSSLSSEEEESDD